MKSLNDVNARLINCSKCPRLKAWRLQVSKEKVRRFNNEKYWAKPVPGFGDSEAKLLIVGLAPAAHGANRTGRMFTGDRSGEWLYRALHKAGYSSKSESTRADDGLKLTGCYISAAIRCAPPANKPLKEEIAACRHFLIDEILALRKVKCFLALGKTAFDALSSALSELGIIDKKSKLRFAHGVQNKLNDGRILACSYHPSQQNTFTGVLTEEMFDHVFESLPIK